jgi:hypothetical protein
MSVNKTSNLKKFADNYDKIDWTKKIKKKFKTSWGAEYTLEIKEKPQKKDVTPTINELTNKGLK